MREPDWEALADVQFVLYNRVANQLNEALSGITLSDMPEASDHPPGYWKERATARVLNVLNMFTAWTWLVRFKMGEPIPERAIRPFYTNELLGWIGVQLQFSPPLTTTLNPLLRANQETLQEALLLLHSVAYTQGSGVRLVCEAATLGTWFRIRFDRFKPLPELVDALITRFGEHWRAQDTLFELTTARDFVRLNGCELLLASTAEYGEFAFFVSATVGKRRTGAMPSVLVATTPEPGASPDSVPLVSGPQVSGPPPVSQLAATAPEIVSSQVSSDTPVMKESEAPPEPVVPPTLAVLRPLPPQMMRAAQLLAAASEGRIAPGEPDEPKTAAGETTAASTDPSGSAAVPEPRPASVIVRARIPEPKLPERLRTPPASTSNVALTRQTQTMARPDALAAGDSEAATPDAPSDSQEERGT